MVTLFDSTTIDERFKESAWIDFLGEMSAMELCNVHVNIFGYEDEDDETDVDPPSLRLSERDRYDFYTIGELLSRIDDWDDISVCVDDKNRLFARYNYAQKFKYEIEFYIGNGLEYFPLGDVAIKCFEGIEEEEEDDEGYEWDC